jgi:pimeloyl-ACP methyl ester carboxylesterase
MAEFEFEGKKIYYEIYGDGEPILLLNGIMMTTKSWTPFIENFSHSNRLILTDFFDQGQSAPMNGPYDHSVQIGLIGALLDELKIEKINICGISYGAEVGLGFAAQFPQRVRRLVVFNAAARATPQLADIGRSWNEAAGVEGGLAYYLATIPLTYSGGFYEKNKQWMDLRKEAIVRYLGNATVKERYVRLTNSSDNYDVTGKLALLDMPVLVVSCEKDGLLPVWEQEALVRHIPDVHHVVISDCGHASVYEKPLLFCSLALGFINTARNDFAL